MIRVFLSHSHVDKPFADALTDLLLRALPLRPDEVRSTSTPGHKPAAGAHTSTQLRSEVQSADVVVGLVSAVSLDSLYVAFELGARWGTEKPLVPLFAPGFDLRALRGPLAEYNGLRADDSADLHKLVRDLAHLLEVEAESPDAYQRTLDALLAVSPSTPEPRASAAPSVRRSQSTAAASRTPPGTPDGDAEAVARAHCEKKWGDNFEMLDQCLTQQREAIAALQRDGPEDVPTDVFAGIRARAAHKWPDHFDMRVYMEHNQVEAYRRTRAG